MTNGLLYVVFGIEYDKLAAHAIKYSRQFTDLPICIVTNVAQKYRHPLWDSIEGVVFVELMWHQRDNRRAKTQMYKYTPFDQTLYLDCDSVIQKPGIEKVFDLLQSGSMVLNLFSIWKEGEKFVRIYRNVMKQLGIGLPLRIYNGAFIAWKQTSSVYDFFDVWNMFWKRTGSGREMGPLACALKDQKMDVVEIGAGDKWFTPDVFVPDSIVQHHYGGDFLKRFGLPVIRTYKPFDKNIKTDWNFVSWDDK